MKNNCMINFFQSWCVCSSAHFHICAPMFSLIEGTTHWQKWQLEPICDQKCAQSKQWSDTTDFPTHYYYSF